MLPISRSLASQCWRAFFWTLLSVGVITILFDLTMRRTINREIIRLVGIKDSLSQNQLSGAGKSSETNWSKILRGKRKFDIIIQNPQGWIEGNLARMLDCGRSRPVEIKFYFPDPKAAYFPFLADKMGIERQAFSHSVMQAVRNVEASWKARKAALCKGSTIEIRLLDREPNVGVFATDDETVVSLSGITGRLGGETGFSYHHDGDVGEFPQSWFHDQFAKLEELPREFEGDIDA